MDNLIKRKTHKFLDYFGNLCMACIPLIGFTLFMLIPMLLSVEMSVMDLRSPIISDGTFIGLENYATLLWGKYSKDFYHSFTSTFIFWLNVPLSMALGLGISWLLNKKLFCKGIFRSVFFIPYICSLTSVALVFRMMYDTNYGIINTFLAHFGIDKVGWITSPEYFMTSAMLMQTWKNLGFCIILFQAALSNVNKTYYEAASIDGADSSTVFRKITLPAISPITYYLLTVCTIGALQVMGEAQILAQDKTYLLNKAFNTVVLYIYDMAFSFPFEYGFGISAAACWILAVFILILTRISSKLSERWVHYEF